MQRVVFRLACLLACWSALWQAPSATAAAPEPDTVHVAPYGNDSWTGKRSQAETGHGPLRTLAAAQRVARRALADQSVRGGVRVLIQPGLYELDEPLTFGPPDSGSADHPTVYQASEPGTVHISGGKRLAPRTSDNRAEAKFEPPKIDAGDWAGGPQLYVNGRRAVLAREPDLGNDWFVGQAVSVPSETAKAQGHEAFRAEAAALAFMRQLNASDRQRALLHIMQSWSSGRHRLAAAAPPDAIRVSPRSRWPFLFFGTSQRFYVENVVAALSQPGEWIGSPTNVRYLLRPDDAAPTTAVMPVLDRLLQIRGAGLTGPYVQHLEFRGLTFQHTRALTPAAGWVDTQAALDVGAAIELDFARHVRLVRCQFSVTGGYAVWLREGVRDSAVLDNDMHDLGAGAVKIGQPPAKGADANTATGANLVRGNRIQATGHQYPGAVALWVGASFDNELSHNSIRDTTYSGISVGWQWGYGAATSGRNRILGNALIDIGTGTLADVGGIYTLGPSPGTLISDNLIREVRGYKDFGAGAWGIYNDEGSSDVQVNNNVVVGTDSGAYHLHYGRNLYVQNNLFALGDAGEVLVTRSDPGRTRLAVHNNLLITGSSRPLAGFAKALDTEYVGNLVAALRPGQALDLTACGDGCERRHAVLTMGPGAKQIRLSGVDAAMARRWLDIAARAGPSLSSLAGGEMPPTADPVAEANGSVAARSTVAAPHPPPALQLTLDLTSSAEYARPPGWRYAPTTPLDAIEVVADRSAPGKRCLQLNDSPAFAAAYEPYVWAQLNHSRGSSSASFAVRIDEQTDLLHEWRDDATPYRTGPHLRITRGGVEVAGRVVAPAEPGTWLQLRVTAPVGEPGPWQLRATDENGKVTSIDALPPKSPGWRSLRWVGFIANGKVTSTTCLADVKVTNEAR